MADPVTPYAGGRDKVYEQNWLKDWNKQLYSTDGNDDNDVSNHK